MTENDTSTILRHLGRLDTALSRVEEKQNASEEKQDQILAQVKLTNGRVTDLEISRATERGAALQRAATIEDVRTSRASDLARNAWIRPAMVAVVVVVLDAGLQHLLG